MVMRNTEVKSYLGDPEPYNAVTDSWTAYKQHFRHFSLANGVTKDGPKLHLFLTLVGTNTFQLLLNLTAPQELEEFSYSQVIEKLTAHYKPKLLKIAKRFHFYKRNQQQGEHLADYVAELRWLAVSCKFGNFLNEVFCDLVVGGIRDEAAQRRLLAVADLTIARTVALTQSMERAQKDSRDIQSPRGSNITLPKEGTYTVVPKKKCYRCLETGNAPADCHFKSVKCNKCHKTGHIAKACQTIESLQGKQTGQKSAQKHKAGWNAQCWWRKSYTQAWNCWRSTQHHLTFQGVTKFLQQSTIFMELDTGAGVTIVNETTWAEKLNKSDLQECSITLHSYPNRSLNVMGSCSVEISINGQTKQLPLCWRWWNFTPRT